MKAAEWRVGAAELQARCHETAPTISPSSKSQPHESACAAHASCVPPVAIERASAVSGRATADTEVGLLYASATIASFYSRDQERGVLMTNSCNG